MPHHSKHRHSRSISISVKPRKNHHHHHQPSKSISRSVHRKRHIKPAVTHKKSAPVLTIQQPKQQQQRRHDVDKHRKSVVKQQQPKHRHNVEVSQKHRKPVPIRELVVAHNPSQKHKQSDRLKLKKYIVNPTPPYPPNLCCGRVALGNDGLRYISKPDKRGICNWVRY